MKEFVISEAQVETAVLVGLITKTQNISVRRDEYLDELAFLAETAGAEVMEKIYSEVRPGKLCDIRRQG